MLNIGSAPNPTPADLRRLGDSGPRERDSFNDRIHQTAYMTPETGMTKAEMMRLEGKTVLGAHGARLGSILAVNLNTRMAEIQTHGGVAVAVPASMLMDKGNRVMASTLSPLDMMAMAKAQTGRTVAINLDSRRMRSTPLRG
jgi:hypothetical protein